MNMYISSNISALDGVIALFAGMIVGAAIVLVSMYISSKLYK